MSRTCWQGNLSAMQLPPCLSLCSNPTGIGTAAPDCPAVPEHSLADGQSEHHCLCYCCLPCQIAVADFDLGGTETGHWSLGFEVQLLGELQPNWTPRAPSVLSVTALQHVIGEQTLMHQQRSQSRGAAISIKLNHTCTMCPVIDLQVVFGF